VREDDHVTVCRTLMSSLCQSADDDGSSRQTADSVRAALKRRFGAVEFTRLHGAISSLVMTSSGGDVARQRRLDAILASNDAAAVYFPLFFQLLQLSVVACRD